MTMTQARTARGGPLDQVTLHHVASMADLEEFRRWAGERRPLLCVDTESAGLRWHADRHRMTQLGDLWDGWAFRYDWLGAAHELLRKYTGRIGLFNAPYDSLVLGHHHNLWLNWAQIDDAQLAGHLFDSAPLRLPNPLALKPRAAFDIDPTAMAWQKGLDEAMKAQKWSYATVPDDFPLYWQYGAGDPVLTCWLLHKFLPEVRGRFSHAYDLELGYARLCAKMMHAGMMIDIPYITHWSDQISMFAEQAMAWLAAYGVTSVDSNDSVGEALIRAGIKVYRTPTGKPRIDKESMEEYQLANPEAAPLISTLRNAKKAQQVVSRHLNKFLSMADAQAVIHYAIHSIGAYHTSRSSVTEPAMQTFDRDFPVIRGSFIPRPGHVFVSWDADQIEARLAAHFSGDKQMIADFAYCDAHDLSFFLLNAQSIYHQDITKKDPRYTTTKNTFYGMTYGSGPETAAITAGVPLAQIVPIYEGFKRRYRQLNLNSLELVESQKRPGHRPRVETMWGRRLYADKAYALIDYRIQGSAAEILKNGALLMDAAGLGDMLRLTIHDELLAEVPIEQAEEVLRLGTEILTDREHYRVPITWSGSILPKRWVKT
jgi:DNA polymerase-1